MASVNTGRGHHLRRLGLTPDDMVLVDFPSYTSMIEGLELGVVGVIEAVPCTNSAVYDIASAPCGLRWIEVPHDNTDAWITASKIAPRVPAVVTAAAGPTNKSCYLTRRAWYNASVLPPDAEMATGPVR